MALSVEERLRMPFAFVGTNTQGGVFGGHGEGITALNIAAEGDALGKIISVSGKIPDPSYTVAARKRPTLYAACHCNEFRGDRGGAVVSYNIDMATGRLVELNHVLLPNPHPTHVSLDATEQWLLVASSAGGAVSVIGITKNGALGPISDIATPEGTPLVAPGTIPVPPFIPGTRLPAGRHSDTIYPHCVILSHDNRVALVSDLFQSRIYSYRFDAEKGKLTPLQSLSQSVPKSGARLLAFHPSGTIFYSVNEFGVSISTYLFDVQNHMISEIDCLSLLPPNSEPDSKVTGSGIAVHPSGRSLYTTIRGLNELVHLAITPDGTPELSHRIACGGEFPRTISLSSDAKHLYCANTQSGTVTTFEIDPLTLMLRQRQVISVPGATHVEFYHS